MANPELTSRILGETHGPFIPFETIKDKLASGYLQLGAEIFVAKGVMVKFFKEAGPDREQGLDIKYIPNINSDVINGKYVDDTYDERGERNGILVEILDGPRVPVSINCSVVDKWSVYLKNDCYGTLIFPFTDSFLNSVRSVYSDSDKIKQGLYTESLGKLKRLKNNLEGIASTTAAKISETLMHGISELGVVTSVRDVLYNIGLHKIFSRVSHEVTVNGELWCFTLDRFRSEISRRSKKDIENISLTTGIGNYVVVPTESRIPTIFRIGVPNGNHICLEKLEMNAIPGELGIRTISLGDISNVMYVNNGALSGYIYSQETLNALIRSVNRLVVSEMKNISISLIDQLLRELEERIKK